MGNLTMYIGSYKIDKVYYIHNAAKQQANTYSSKAMLSDKH